jgi:SAM-dependent methyltransferase
MATARPDDSWNQGDPYERYVGRWSSQVAPRFLDWLGVPASLRWLDVGCGTGALTAAIAAQGRPASLMGVDPSEGFLRSARARLGDHATFQIADARDLPLPDASVDVVVSGLALNFVPQPERALAQMRRVTVAGGRIAAYVWDYAGRMELMRHFWDAAVALFPEAAALDEGPRFPLCQPDALQAAFGNAGLATVTTAPIDIDTRFASFDDYWSPFLGGQGPAPAFAMSLDAGARERLRERLARTLPSRADGTIELVARAWAVQGIAPGTSQGGKGSPP